MRAMVARMSPSWRFTTKQQLRAEKMPRHHGVATHKTPLARPLV